MLQLNLSIQDAKTRLDITDPFLSLKTPDPQINIAAGEAKIEIHQPDAMLEIDQTAFYNACGQKSIRDQEHDNAQKAYGHVLEVIGKMARDGVSLSDHKTTIPQLAKAAMISQPPAIELASIPQPTIRILPHAAEVQVQQGNLDIHFQQGKVEGNFQPGSVTLQMLQYPDVKAWVSGSNLDIAV